MMTTQFKIFLLFCLFPLLSVRGYSLDSSSAEPAESTSKVESTASNIQMNQTPSYDENKRALAEQDFNDHRFLELGLEYPINFGIHLKYLVSDSIYTRMGLGFMPKFFLDSFEQLSPSFGHINEEETKVLSNTFENSLYLDFRLAWSPYSKRSGGGPYMELGVSRMLYGKGELKGDLLSKALGEDDFDETKSYSAKTNTYNLTAHIGYQIPFEKIKLNIEVGLIKILQSHILLETSAVADQLLNEKQQESFKNFLKKKGWIFPTVSAWISFSF